MLAPLALVLDACCFHVGMTVDKLTRRVAGLKQSMQAPTKPVLILLRTFKRMKWKPG